MVQLIEKIMPTFIDSINHRRYGYLVFIKKVFLVQICVLSSVSNSSPHLLDLFKAIQFYCQQN